MSNKGNKPWVWLALDADMQEIVDDGMETRNETAAHKLVASFCNSGKLCGLPIAKRP